MKAAPWIALLPLSACAPVVEGQAAKAYNLRIQDAVRAYEAASRAGDPLDMCVKAKLVAAAYDDAREPASAEAWRAREREACQLALRTLGVGAAAE